MFETSAKKALEAAAFEFIELEDLLFEEQQAVFAESDVIVAVHGAALTNLLFADNCRVVEIIPSTYGIRPDYFQIAMQSGHRCECLVVDGLQGTDDLRITSEVADAICDMAADGKDMD